ncbi:MAG: cyclase family protein [Chlamydiae bacterium]|nr:cyclase family protein [Chlamydiota bacterium]
MLFSKFSFKDLTQPLSSKAPTWNGSCGFCLEIKKDYDRIFRVQQMKMHAGVGTHMDAPSHRFETGLSIADIPLDQLFAPLCIIDVSAKADADYRISLEDLKAYEAAYGQIPQNALVLGFTGWCRFWENSDAYRNLDANGEMHFPAFSAMAATYLLERKIVGLGIDTLSPDCLDPDFAVHKLILGAGKYILENIGDCSSIPAKDAYAIALPLRAEKSTECPIRLAALIPD